MLAVCTVAGGMFFTRVNSNNGRLENTIAKVEARTESYVPRQDLDNRSLSSRSDGTISSG